MRCVVLVSAAAHVLAIACILHLDLPHGPVSVTVPVTEAISLDLDETDRTTPGVAAETPAAIAMVTRSTPRTHAIEAAPVHEIEPPASTPPYAGNTTIVVFAPNIGLGAPEAANPFLRPGALPPAEAVTPSGDAFDDVPANKRAEQAVKDALRARDQDIGLGLEGPVVHALEDATHAGFAPDHGIATFTAVIDEHGLVIDLHVLGTHDAGWDDVRTRAARELVKAKIDLRGAKGAQLRIEVTSDVRMASGTDPNRKYVVTGDRKRLVLESAAGGSPSGADVVEAREVGKFDVTDLAGKPTRVVHAKLVMLVTR